MTQLSDLVSEFETLSYMSNQTVEDVVDMMIQMTKVYVRQNNIKSLVMGVSGGLDSAVVAALLQESNTGVPLLGLSIPMSSSDAHKEQALWVGNYCTEFEEFRGWDDAPYTEMSADYGDKPYEVVDSILQQTHEIAGRAGFGEFPHHILQGNTKARLRMMTLYDLARKTNGMVLSTDNLSEYLAGFWTINGDVGDYGIIQNIWKGFELPQIAKYIGIREDIISQKPSDGLGVTEEDNDEAQLGMTYQEFDTIMAIYTAMIPDAEDGSDDRYYRMADDMDKLQDDDGPDSVKINMALQRHAATGHKRGGTVNLTRFELGLDD